MILWMLIIAVMGFFPPWQRQGVKDNLVMYAPIGYAYILASPTNRLHPEYEREKIRLRLRQESLDRGEPAKASLPSLQRLFELERAESLVMAAYGVRIDYLRLMVQWIYITLLASGCILFTHTKPDTNYAGS